MAPREAQRRNGGCNGLPVPFRETNQAVALRQRVQEDRDFDSFFWIGEALTNPLLRVRVVITRSWIILSLVDYRRSPGGNPTVSTFTLELPQERDPTETAVSVRRAFELLGDGCGVCHCINRVGDLQHSQRAPHRRVLFFIP